MSDRPHSGRVVLITGAASGFGALAARRFAERGDRLVLADLDGEALRQVAQALDGTAFSYEADVSDPEAMADLHAQTAAEFGRLDVAINNAGVSHALKPLHLLEAHEFDRVMAVNARGVFLGLKHQIPMMRAQGQGVILNVASAAGLVGAGRLAAYAASKHAVVGLTRSAADELGGSGVRVNALCPSFAETPLLDGLAAPLAERHGLSAEEAQARIAARVPMGRVARAEEVVQVIIWLTSDENSFMTGQAIALDGGLSAV